MAEIRRPVRNLVCYLHVDLHARLVSDGRNMKHRICGAAQGHIHCKGIHESFLRHDIPGTYIFPVHFHHGVSGALGKSYSLGIDSRNGAVAPKSHSDGLGQAVHGIRGIHTRAASAGRAGVLVVVVELGVVYLSGSMGSHGLKHGGERRLLPVNMTGEHRASGDEDRRDIYPCRSHQKAGHVLIAVGNADHCVKLMGKSHALGGIRDQVPCHKGILHADMPHRYTVANRNGREYHGHSAGFGYSELNRLHYLVYVHMPRNYLII